MRTKIAAGELSEFLEPLVGTPAAIEGFGVELRNSVAVDEGIDFFADEPYTRLFRGLRSHVEEVAHGLDAKKRVKSAFVRATLASGGMVISVLESFGKVYEEKAEVPQDLERVLENVKHVTRYAIGMAHADSKVGMANRWALTKGVDPNAPGQFRKLVLFNALHDLGFVSTPSEIVSKSSLKVDVDEVGQLDIDFRYKRKASTNDKHACPAAGFKVGGEGSKRYAVPTFSNLVGAVVATEIFPKIFEIKQ